MKDTALLVIDMQTALIQDNPYNIDNVLKNIEQLINLYRDNLLEVIYVRHDGGANDELEYGSNGWQIYSTLSPKNDEKVFDKRYNSAFKKTGLKEYLDLKNIKNIIIIGMQTEYCMDASIKVAFEYGYEIIIPKETNTTYDNDFLTGKELCEFYNDKIWDHRYAKVMTIEELEKKIKIIKSK